MRKAYLTFSLLVLASLLLSACAAPTAAPAPAAKPAATTAPPAAKTGGKTIVFAALQGIELDGIKAVIPTWQQKTGNKVELVELPYANLQEKVFNDLQAGAGSYDVIFADDPWFPFMAGNGYLTPFSKFGYTADPDFVQRSLDVCTWPPPFGPRTPGTAKDAKGELYALPELGNVQMFWYRKDLMSEPKDIPDLIAQTKAKADPAKGVYGYVHRGARGNPVVTNFNAWNWSYGGDIFDDSWKVIVNGPKSVQALTDYISLLPLAPPGAANFNADEVGAAMLNGSSLNAIVWPAFNAQIDDATKSKVSGKIAIIQFPKGEKQTSQIGNWVMAIPKAAKNPDVAFDFVKFATSADSQRIAAEKSGAPPTRKSVLQDANLQKKNWWFPAEEKALGAATWRPRTPEWNKVEDILGTYLSKAITKEMAPQAALDQAAKEITQVMTAAGYYK